jgi:starvation-inducible DNA-binding protein
MKIKIGITDKHLHKSSALLSTSLSDEMVLYVKTRNFHWNVSGESFMELHKLFESHYKELEESIDQIAERIGKLGDKTIGTMHEFLKHSSIKEHPGKHSSSKDMIKELLADHQTVIVKLRKDIDECSEKNKDAGTADFLTGLMEKHETIAWILRRYLH